MHVPSFGPPRFTPGDGDERFKLGESVPGAPGGADILTKAAQLKRSTDGFAKP
jgi:hypothetical protein